MYELIKLTDSSYYIQSPAKIGIIVKDNNAFVIDSGNDKDAGKKVLKILNENSWRLMAVLNTHSHADHIGGNQYLQKQTGCKIYAPGIERDFTCHPILEPDFLYGGNSINELRHKFLMAQPSETEYLTADILPEGIDILPLPGHSFDMVGFKTDDGVVYLADCLSSEATLNKYKISFLNDVEAYLDTLEKAKNMDGKIFVPSHAEPTENIAPLAQYNIDCVLEICENITKICKDGCIFEQLLEKIFEKYNLQMTFEQYALVGSTVKSYLTYLKNTGKISVDIDANKMLWKTL